MSAGGPGVRDLSIGVAVVGFGDSGGGIDAEARIRVVVFVCNLEEGQVETEEKAKQETRQENMVRQFLLFSEAFVDTLGFLLEVFGEWVEIALQDAVEGAVVVAGQGAALLEHFHGPGEIYPGPSWWWRDLFDDFDAVLQS